MNKYKIVVSVPYYTINEYEVEAESSEEALKHYWDGLADCTWEGGLESEGDEEIVETTDITDGDE